MYLYILYFDHLLTPRRQFSPKNIPQFSALEAIFGIGGNASIPLFSGGRKSYLFYSEKSIHLAWLGENILTSFCKKHPPLDQRLGLVDYLVGLFTWGYMLYFFTL